MSPHKQENGSANGASDPATVDMGDSVPSAETALKAGFKALLGAATFDNPLDEREYLKGRLAAAFRIFGKYGFDEGVAGKI
jgi:hypothetical protein